MSGQSEVGAVKRNLLWRTTYLVGLLSLLSVSPVQASFPQASDNAADAFHWVHPTSNPALWEKILREFNEELTPDEATPGKSGIDVYGYKYLERVGIFDHSALVIVGHRSAKDVRKGDEWNEYYSAFNLDLTTGEKSSIDHAE